MLREELCDSDIPHCTTVHNRLTEVWDEHLASLETDMKVWSICVGIQSRWLIAYQGAMGKISMTMDLWSDPNLSPFMAVTAHWIEAKPISTPNGPQFELTLRADLIGFHQVPGRHTVMT